MTEEQKILIETLNDLSKKIDVLTTVTATTILQGKQFTDKVSVLLEMGLDTKEIASILRTSQNSVRSIKSRLSRKPKRVNEENKKLR